MLAQSAVQSYKQNSVITADPLKLILMAYDKAISGCRQRDLKLLGQALNVLINGLNMDAGNISWSLLAIYQYCSELAREGQYNEAMKILQELRDTWADVKYSSIS